jgi:hypothetical protein
MRHTFLVLVVGLTLTSAWGQQSPVLATTEDGRKILVYPDGTWKLADQVRPQGSPGIGNNPGIGHNNGPSNSPGPGNNPETGNNSGEQNNPPGNSKVFVKAPQGSFGVWIDKQKWTENPSNNTPIKTTFVHQGDTSYAMIIGERVTISMEALERAAMSNAKKVAPDVTLLFKEKRVVSGKHVLCMQMTGTIDGTSFMYYGYYYGGPEGTLQVICYTTPEQFDQAKTDFDEFLSGIQIGLGR